MKKALAGLWATCALLLLTATSGQAAEPDVVLYAADAVNLKGNWTRIADASGAGGKVMSSKNIGWSANNAPLAAPFHSFDFTFNAAANTPYHVWVRMRAIDNSKFNDSLYAQFSDARDVKGLARYRLGTTDALLVNLATTANAASLAGWGWQDGAYWFAQATTVKFESGGSHTLRIQTREDGVQLDQVVLSASTYLSNSPGSLNSDNKIVPKPVFATSYGPAAIALPGIVEAEFFDNGGSGIGYHDVSSGNTGGAFRQTDVDIESSTENDYDIGWISAGEWLSYATNVQAAGNYVLAVRVASLGDGGTFHVEFRGTDVTGPMTIPNTGGWQAWTTLTKSITIAAAGAQQMRVVFDSSGPVAVGNLNWVRLSAPDAPLATAYSQRRRRHLRRRRRRRHRRRRHHRRRHLRRRRRRRRRRRPTGQTVTVVAGGDLQAALNSAQPGDTILLQAGATFTGNFILPAKTETSTSFITIRSSASDSALPGPTSRINPSYAALLPKIKSPNTEPALRTAPGAHHYRLLFLEFPATYQGYYDIIRLGDGSSAQNNLASVPYELVVDRVYVHGDPVYGQKRGICLNSASTSILNSYIAEIKGEGFDTQAVGGWNGPGPYTITNNYLEAAGENLMFGGADPAIANLVPSDITITRNLLSKPSAWRNSRWTIKNLLELKSARRVIISGNILEYNWLAAQAGYAVQFTPRNQDGAAPWSVVENVEFSNNVVRHAAGGINILGVDNNYPSLETNNIVIRNNLFENLSSSLYGGQGRWVQMTGGGRDITLDHNTVLQDGWTVVAVNAVGAELRFHQQHRSRLQLGHLRRFDGAGEQRDRDVFPVLDVPGQHLRRFESSELSGRQSLPCLTRECRVRELRADAGRKLPLVVYQPLSQRGQRRPRRRRGFRRDQRGGWHVLLTTARGLGSRCEAAAKQLDELRGIVRPIVRADRDEEQGEVQQPAERDLRNHRRQRRRPRLSRQHQRQTDNHRRPYWRQNRPDKSRPKRQPHTTAGRRLEHDERAECDREQRAQGHAGQTPEPDEDHAEHDVRNTGRDADPGKHPMFPGALENRRRRTVADPDRHRQREDLQDRDAAKQFGLLRADPCANQRIGQNDERGHEWQHGCQRQARSLEKNLLQPVGSLRCIAFDDEGKEHAIQLTGQALGSHDDPVGHRPHRHRCGAHEGADDELIGLVVQLVGPVDDRRVDAEARRLLQPRPSEQRPSQLQRRERLVCVRRRRRSTPARGRRSSPQPGRPARRPPSAPPR